MISAAEGSEECADAVTHLLSPSDGVELLRVTDEDEYFPPPRNIRDLQTAIGTAAAAMLGADRAASALADDRAMAASDVLAALQPPASPVT